MYRPLFGLQAGRIPTRTLEWTYSSTHVYSSTLHELSAQVAVLSGLSLISSPSKAMWVLQSQSVWARLPEVEFADKLDVLLC